MNDDEMLDKAMVFFMVVAGMALLLVSIAGVIALTSCSSTNTGLDHPPLYTLSAPAGGLDSYTSTVPGDYVITPLDGGPYWYGAQDKGGAWNWDGPADGQVIIHVDGVACAQWGIVVYDGVKLTFTVRPAKAAL